MHVKKHQNAYKEKGTVTNGSMPMPIWYGYLYFHLAPWESIRVQGGSCNCIWVHISRYNPFGIQKPPIYLLRWDYIYFKNLPYVYDYIYVYIYVYIYIYLYINICMHTALRRAEAPERPERYTGYKRKSLTGIPSPEQHTRIATWTSHGTEIQKEN